MWDTDKAVQKEYFKLLLLKLKPKHAMYFVSDTLYFGYTPVWCWSQPVFTAFQDKMIFYFIPICKILQLKGGILEIGYTVILKFIYLYIFFIFLSSAPFPGYKESFFCDSSLSLKETSCSNTNTHLINYPGNWLHSDRMSLLTAPEMKASTLIGIFTSYFLSLMFPQRICWSGGRFPKMSIFLSFTWQNMFSNPSSSWGKLKRGWFYNCVVNFNFNLPLYSTQDVAVSSDFMWACRTKKKKKIHKKSALLYWKSQGEWIKLVHFEWWGH